MSEFVLKLENNNFALDIVFDENRKCCHCKNKNPCLRIILVNDGDSVSVCKSCILLPFTEKACKSEYISDEESE